MPMCRRHRKHHSLIGFTLLEVLAALLVLGIAMTAWQLRIAQNLDGAAYLRDRTIASWVARNQLELLHVARRYGSAAPVGALQGAVTMGGRTWYWVLAPRIAVAGASDDELVPVTVAVSMESIEAARSAPLVTLDGASHAWR